MSVKNRIKEFLEAEGITVSSFEKMINSANGYVNSISKSVGVDKIQLILEKFPHLNLEWLLTGKGSMYKEKEVAPELFILLEERASMIDLQKKYIKNLEDQLKQDKILPETIATIRAVAEDPSELKK